jgi:hypothetical protein
VLGKGDCTVAIVGEKEQDSLLQPGGFHRQNLESAREREVRIGIIYIGREKSFAKVSAFLREWAPEAPCTLIRVPETELLLDGILRVTLKTTLNSLSTCTMVRLGRVMGNYMIWVVPSNLKLIDRATRYIQRLTDLEYKPANQLLFEVIEYVEPRMKADQAYPPVVGVAVMRVRHGLDNQQAEERLMSELGK